ncbi:MAG: nicotinate-nicotinamide nucleotide adenylyltransferase [Bdellovibrionota bacterium]
MKSAKQKIGFFGGSFDPPHVGHALAACYARLCLGLDQVWIVPSKKHPFKQESATFEQRMEMCKQLFSPLGSSFVVSDVENNPQLDGRTLHSLRMVQQLHPQDEFVLLLGSDLQSQTSRWYQFDQLSQEFHVDYIPREPNTQSFAIPNISSTQCKKDLALGKEVIEGLAPFTLDYIRKHKLYQTV